MATFRLSQLAEFDLIDIAIYTVRTWGEAQAGRYLSELEHCCQLLADRPSIGRSCSEIRPGLRRMEHSKHVILYRRAPDGILVSRILHERMLPERQDME